MKKKWKQITMLVAVLLMMILLPTTTFAANSTPGKVTLSKISAPAFNKISISWKKASNATSYNIYYRKTGTSKWTKIASVPSSKTSYTHTSSSKYPIVVGQKYDYTICAFNKYSRKSGSYNKTGLTTKTIPETVKLGKLSMDNALNITVSWNKAGGCNYYVVYRRTPSTNWEKIATVPASKLSYTDHNCMTNDTNYYTVKSYYSKTKTYGKFDNTGLSINVPKPDYDDFDDDDDDDWDKPTDDDNRPTTADPEAMAQEVLRLTNIERAKYGRAPLIYNKTLEKGAMARAKEIYTYFSHTRVDGQNFPVTYNENGAGNISGENIASGYRTPEDVVQGWMNSNGHRAAIIASDNKYLGVGFYESPLGGYYWVQGFASANPDSKGTVVFDANGGTFNDGNTVYTVTAPFGTRIYLNNIPVPTKNGYTFDCWVSNYGEKLNSVGAGTKRTFHAEWIPN